VQGRRAQLVFDLESLFENPGDLQPGPVLEAVLEPALRKAAEHVRTYDWAAEQNRFVAWSVHGIDAQIATWRRQILDNDYELDRVTTMTAGLVRKNIELKEFIARCRDWEGHQVRGLRGADDAGPLSGRAVGRSWCVSRVPRGHPLHLGDS
jgi:hypothetical protein